MKMRGFTVAVVALLVGFAGIAGAQTKFSIGARTGLNIGSLSYDPERYAANSGITKSGSIGFIAGAVAELEFAGMFAVEAEPRFVTIGTKWEQGTAKQTASGSVLEIPIHFKTKFLKGTVRPYAFVGPNIGIVLSAREKLEGTNQDYDVDTKANTSSTNFALDFGGGAQFNIAKNVALTGDVRFSLGLSNLNNAQAVPGAAVTSVKTRGFQIVFGALFAI